MCCSIKSKLLFFVEYLNELWFVKRYSSPVLTLTHGHLSFSLNRWKNTKGQMPGKGVKKDKWKVTVTLPVPNGVCQRESYPKGKTKASSGGKCNKLSSFSLHLVTLCRLVWWVTFSSPYTFHSFSIRHYQALWLSLFCFYDARPCYLWEH